MSASVILLLTIAVIIFLAICRVPIWAAIFVGTVIIQFFVNHLPLSGIFITITEGLSKVAFMCVPFFMLTGALVEASSLGRRLIDFCVVLFRKARSGLAVACLIANAFFGAVSGSANASVALFGKIMYTPLRENYDDSLSLGLICSSSTLSAIIPPSLTMIMYGIATSTSIAKLFTAGFIPGIAITVVVLIYLIVRNRLHDRQTAAIQADAGQNVASTVELSLKRAFIRALPILFLPVLIFGGIYGGIFTPTEAGAVSSLYTLLIVVLLRDIDFRRFTGVLKSTMTTCGFLFALIGASIAFAQAITVAQVLQKLEVVLSHIGPIGFLLLLNAVLLVAGCFLDGTCAILILAPIFVPVGVALGLNPIHLGIVFTVNLSLGMFTPPFGLAIFTLQGVTGAKYGAIVRAVVPFIVIYLLMTLLFTFVPAFSTWLPGLIY